MPPINRSEYLYGRPLLERFISSSRFSHSGSNVITSERPTATLRASVSADDPLGLVIPGGAGLSISLLRHDLRAYIGALYTYRSACARCCDGPRRRSGAKRHVNYETLSQPGNNKE